MNTIKKYKFKSTDEHIISENNPKDNQHPKIKLSATDKNNKQ